MSMRDKLLAAARVAATEERARCLWCADQVLRELEQKLSGKFLLTAMHEQGAKIKLQIARAVVSELRRAIVSGVRPVIGQEAGAADSSPPVTEAALAEIDRSEAESRGASTFCLICGNPVGFGMPHECAP